jgi:OFA family oxalate/formate antiporter-like MFS transporter
MKRYLILAASLVIQVCLGGVYAWSVFVPRLVDDHALTTAQTQAVFGTTIAVFTGVMVYSGRLVERRGPRALTVTAGLLFTSGYLVAAVATHWLGILLGIGVLAGAGIGAGYVCPLTVSMRWFPAHRGLITGITVAGFGSGAVLLSTIAERMFAAGMGADDVFLVVGLAYGALIVASGLVLAVPGTTSVKAGGPIAIRRALADRVFWGLTLGMFSGTFTGLMVIGNLKPLALDEGVSPAAATAAVSALAAGNALGRVTWGWLHDRVGRVVVPVSLLALGAAVTGLMSTSSDGAFIALSVAAGFGFGACFVLYAAEVATRWGIDHVGSVYPLVFLAYGLSGILGPVTGGWLFDLTGDYGPAVLVAAGLTVGGAAAVTALHAPRLADESPPLS